MLVELKSGKPNLDHRAEHLFYALVKTLKSGVAPARVATYYLDDNSWIVDETPKSYSVWRLTGSWMRWCAGWSSRRGRTPRTRVCPHPG